jgi:RHS repeat-associated protein
VADATGTTVWRWDQAEPFGANPADQDPDANSVAFDLPLRLPGQRYDTETGLYYNYFRDYDPSIGRYGESDPIGLAGGVNTYAYVSGSPLMYVDPSGQLRWFGSFQLDSGGAYVSVMRGRFNLVSECDIDGNRGFATVFGITASLSFGSPYTNTSGYVEFVEGEIRAMERVFWGRFAVTSVGAQAGKYGGSLTTIFLGEAVSTKVKTKSGFDLNAQLRGVGVAEVTNFRRAPCKCTGQ